MIGKAAGITARCLAVSLAGAVAPGESAFPGANGRIVFQRGAAYDGGPSSLYLVNADGTGLVRLTRGYQHDAQADVVAGRLADRVRIDAARRHRRLQRWRRTRAGSAADVLAGLRRRPRLERRRQPDRVRDDPQRQLRHLLDSQRRNRAGAADDLAGRRRRSGVVTGWDEDRIHE